MGVDMLSRANLEDNFYPVEELSAELIRCGDELPQKTIYTYFKLGQEDDCAPFIVSDDMIDDEFAASILNQAGYSHVDGLTKAQLALNDYGFSHVLYVPFFYHSELKGRLDEFRPNTKLCIPIYNPEFSGTETPEEFCTLRRSVVPTARWRREVFPKISLRFDNTRTGSGTGDGYIFVKIDQVMSEIDNLIGVEDGFIEILNYRGEVVEILFFKDDIFTWIRDRDDASGIQISHKDIKDHLWRFLTSVSELPGSGSL